MPRVTLEGFTLAELLIALLILGEIATFTIPKILSSSQNAQKNAVFKETIGALSEALYLYCLSPEASANPNPYVYLSGRINTVKLCPSNASTQGCMGTSSSGEITEPGFVLHNGAMIAGLRNATWPDEGILIDWNGNAGSNVIGDDQIEVVLNFRSSQFNGVRTCTVAPRDDRPASVSLFKQIYN